MFSYTGTGAQGGFCLCDLALVSHDPLYLPVSFSNCGVNSCPCVLTFLTDPRKVVGFPGCLGHNGDFQAPHMWNWKSQILDLLLIFSRSYVN